MGVGFPDKKVVRRSEITEGGHLSTTEVARFELHWETELTVSEADDLEGAVHAGDNEGARRIIEKARRQKNLSLTDLEREALQLTFRAPGASEDPTPVEPRIHFEHFEDHASDQRTIAGWRIEAIASYPDGTGPDSDPLEVLAAALDMDPPLDAAAQDVIRALVNHLRSEGGQQAE